MNFQRRSLLWNLCAVCCVWGLAANLLHAQTPPVTNRYRGELNDGTLVEAPEILGWHETQSQPSLDSRPLFDKQNPIRWIVDLSTRYASLPEAYVEFWNGDRLPGRVLLSQSGSESPYDQLPAQLVVEGRERWFFPRRPQGGQSHVLLTFVKRIVWERQQGEEHVPSTLFTRDGRRIAYQALRWQGASVLLLLQQDTLEIPFLDIAELHLPAQDAWQKYIEQLTILSPTAEERLLQWDTIEGLRVTGSQDRFQAQSHGNDKEPNNWYHLLQPAWSREPLWVPHRSIRVRRYFAPHQPPLTLFDPARSPRQLGLGGGWSWQRDRNVQGGLLRCGEQEYAWGLGTQAHQELIYTCPPGAVRIRTQIGLDRAVGSGGCARAYLRGGTAEQPPRLDGPGPAPAVLVGSDQPAGWQELALAGLTEFVLISDPFHEGRPAGADPFEIRDLVNWLQPELTVDPGALTAQIRQAAAQQIPAFSGWDVVDAAHGPLQLISRWQAYNQREPAYLTEVRAAGPFLTLTRQQKITPLQKYLLLAVARTEQDTEETTLQVRIDGQPVGEFPAPKRHSQTDPAPILVPLTPYSGKTVQLEISQISGGNQAYVDWRSIAFVDRHPGLLTVWDDEPAWLDELTQGDGQATRDVTVGFSGNSAIKVQGGEIGHNLLLSGGVKIREQPRLGEYRFIRFAWKKPAGQPLGLQLAADGRWGERSTNQERLTFRYDAGQGDRIYGGARRLQDRLPQDWVVVTRDLVADFGEFSLTGLAFIAPDVEPAWFDSITLAREQADFEALPIVPHPSRMTEKK